MNRIIFVILFFISQNASSDVIEIFDNSAHYVGNNFVTTFQLHYDSQTWTQINQATVTVLLVDDDTGFIDSLVDERADVVTVNAQSVNVPVIEVDDNATWYWNIDVTPFMSIGDSNGSLNFRLAAVEGDFDYLRSRLTINFEPERVVPLPAAIWLFLSVLPIFLIPGYKNFRKQG